MEGLCTGSRIKAGAGRTVCFSQGYARPMAEGHEHKRKTLPRGRNALEPEIVAADQRGRVLDAMSELVNEHGYSGVRVTDLIARAGIAKPTFYELYESKLACFIALVDEIIEQMIAAIAAPLDPEGTNEERIEQGISGLVDFVINEDQRARVIIVEAAAAGPEAIERTVEVYETLASFYVALREETRRTNPNVPPLTQARARSIVGAINEPLASSLRRGALDEIPALRGDLIDAVTLLATGHNA